MAMTGSLKCCKGRFFYFNLSGLLSLVQQQMTTQGNGWPGGCATLQNCAESRAVAKALNSYTTSLFRSIRRRRPSQELESLSSSHDEDLQLIMSVLLSLQQ